MKNIFKLLGLCALVAAAASCSSSRAEQMKLAERLGIDCTPEVLALVGDKIPVDLAVTYPDGYFHPKATLDVTPVLVYAGGEQVGPTFTYQGEKVLDNFTVVPTSGGTVRQHVDLLANRGQLERAQRTGQRNLHVVAVILDRLQLSEIRTVGQPDHFRDFAGISAVLGIINHNCFHLFLLSVLLFSEASAHSLYHFQRKNAINF